jgi:uncharacterized membrane protein
VTDLQQGFPKARLDALTDGVFAFAMTLLVLNLELPDDFKPTSSAELLEALGGLRDSLLVYVISFLVLAVFWLGQAGDRNSPDQVGATHIWAVLALLFFTTITPFSTQFVGRYQFPPAVWLYAANMILLAVSAMAISLTEEREAGSRPKDDGRVDLIVLMIAAALSAAISVFSMEWAMYAYFLNFAAPLVKRRLRVN